MSKLTVNRVCYVLLGSFLIFLLINWFIEGSEKKMLEKYKKTTAIIIEIHKPEVIHDLYSGTFQYKLNYETYEFTQVGKFTMLEIGDSVEIKYAVGDYSVAEVSDKFYMKKYRHLKNGR